MLQPLPPGEGQAPSANDQRLEAGEVGDQPAPREADLGGGRVAPARRRPAPGPPVARVRVRASGETGRPRPRPRTSAARRSVSATPRRSGNARRSACSRTLRATDILQSSAIVTGSSRLAGQLVDQLEPDGLGDVEVRARRSGRRARAAPSRSTCAAGCRSRATPSAALVTQGGLPTTRSGPRWRQARSRRRSRSKRLARTIATSTRGDPRARPAVAGGRGVVVLDLDRR